MIFLRGNLFRIEVIIQRLYGIKIMYKVIEMIKIQWPKLFFLAWKIYLYKKIIWKIDKNWSQGLQIGKFLKGDKNQGSGMILCISDRWLPGVERECIIILKMFSEEDQKHKTIKNLELIEL